MGAALWRSKEVGAASTDLGLSRFLPASLCCLTLRTLSFQCLSVSLSLLRWSCGASAQSSCIINLQALAHALQYLIRESRSVNVVLLVKGAMRFLSFLFSSCSLLHNREEIEGKKNWKK
jgi:hypothetical protein